MGAFLFFWGGADFLIFLALHGSTNGTVYEFVHAFSALCGVIFYYLLLPLRDKNVYALNFCAISGGVFFIALIAWHLLLDLPYLWVGIARPFALSHITLTLPTAKAGGFLLQPSLPTIDRSYTMSTSVGITPSFRVPHGTYV